MLAPETLVSDSILRIGEVSEVNGRRVFIRVDKNKNLSDIFFGDDILKNISVNSFIEIRKGFLTIIGRVEGERTEEELSSSQREYDEPNKNRRFLTVALSGFIDQNGRFIGGTRELPLIGNEAYILTKEKIHRVHNLVGDSDLSVNIATSDSDGFDIEFPIDSLFNSHIAVFGNTGSGKSNTLAYLYQEFVGKLRAKDADSFEQKCKFILFDFNGEYALDHCITGEKKVYNLSTRTAHGDKIPIDDASLLDIELLSVLSDASEKTQKPLLKRALSLYAKVHREDVADPLVYFRGILRNQVERVLQMSDKVRANLVIDYLREVLPPLIEDGVEIDLIDDLEWHNMNEGGYKFRNQHNVFLQQRPDLIPDTKIHQHIANFEFDADSLKKIVSFLYAQLIQDILTNRAQNEHVAPVINKLLSKMKDIRSIFDTTPDGEFWEKNFVVINLHDVNLEMKKTIPLLLSKKIYAEHKRGNREKSLTIIIDEAHNILSKESAREAESWKDYRLETFEEIIKEGRKFGVFVTISSQRPNDISPTITSQAHNYFIHRLINQKDLETISSAVSYIDKVTEESIPTLPTGTCIFSGIASQMPLKLNIKELAYLLKPRSHTLTFESLIESHEADQGLD